MKKGLRLSILLLCFFAVSGCGLLPFQEDLPTLSENGKDAEDTVLAIHASATPTPDPYTEEERRILRQAAELAYQYDYDGAAECIRASADYEESSVLQEAAGRYDSMKAACVEYPAEKVTHVFFHTLIRDTQKAFDGDEDEAGYNQYMTTIDEFNRILQILYQKGYVLVSPHDLAQVGEDGSMERKKLMLPPGKTPFVMSQDDVSYYHYMEGDGFASRLVLDENGEVKCEYIEDDGTVSVGDYDLVPLLDAFVKEHPDFSYHGRKGILALTGYNGVLGYRTDEVYRTGENLQENQREYLKAHPEFDFEEELRQATEVAEAMKASGWEFASHTWGHRNVDTTSLAELKQDNKRWKRNAAPILGETDMIIFAFGADIGNWQEYTMENKKYAYYRKSGYRYYCNVDSSQYWVQLTGDYFRQGRRNLDGYRMYYFPEMLEDLFAVEDVWDDSRPVPVPKI